MKKLLCLMGGALLLSNINAQKTITPLVIDDPFPDISFGKVINYKDSTASRADFKGKLILFDFWFTHCSVCIEMMPELDSLQRLYGKHLQIIMVTKNAEMPVRSVIKNWEQKHHTKWIIPMITGDTILHQYFRHRYEPHYVWLAPENRVVAQTSSFFVSKKIMSAYLEQLPFEITKTGYSLDSIYQK